MRLSVFVKALEKMCMCVRTYTTGIDIYIYMYIFVYIYNIIPNGVLDEYVPVVCVD